MDHPHSTISKLGFGELIANELFVATQDRSIIEDAIARRSGNISFHSYARPGMLIHGVGNFLLLPHSQCEGSGPIVPVKSSFRAPAAAFAYLFLDNLEFWEYFLFFLRKQFHVLDYWSGEQVPEKDMNTGEDSSRWGREKYYSKENIPCKFAGMEASSSSSAGLHSTPIEPEVGTCVLSQVFFR